MRHENTILLAESGIPDLYLLSDLCRQRGYCCHIARDGRELLETARRERPDFIIAGAAMPDIPTAEAAEWLKADPATSNIPIIVLSDQWCAGYWLNGTAAGADYLLAKPRTLQQLLDTVRLFIGEGP